MMKSKFVKRMLIFLCVFCMSLSFGSCSLVDGVFDYFDELLNTNSSSNLSGNVIDSSNSSDDTEYPDNSSTPYIIEKTVDYGDFFVTYPSHVICHVGDTFEINITASNYDTLSYDVLIIEGRDDYFSVNERSVTALSVCCWQVCAKVSELDIWYVTEIEVLA